MKNDKKLDMMNLIDEDLIEEANPKKFIRQKSNKRLLIRILSACMCFVVLAVSLAVIIPNINTNENDDFVNDDDNGVITGISKSQASYKDIKNLLNSYVYDKNEDTNTGEIVSPDIGDSMNQDQDGAGAGGYVEVTDNQVQGVIEGDLFKRTESHIFYLRDGSLHAYSIDKESSKLVGKCYLNGANEYSACEMYISADGRVATVIYETSSGFFGIETVVEMINIENPYEMSSISKVRINGSYSTSRYFKGQILVFTRLYVRSTDNEFDYIPSVNCGAGFELIPAESVIACDKINTKSYLIVSEISDNDLEHKETKAFLGFDDTVYVTGGKIYLTRGFSENIYTDNRYSSKNFTEIFLVDFSDEELELKGSVAVEGIIKNQYSMDEYNGILRVFTTVTEGNMIVDYIDKYGGMVGTVESTNQSASLFCIDVKEMKIVATVDSFAPQGESVQSARFDKNKAYVCTAIVFSDPVFFFDLSDLNNITYKDTGDINGYSHSLIQLKDGYLLGIGQTDFDTVKLEIYKETENGVVAVSKYEMNQASISTDYKSYYINREKGILGLGFQSYGYNGNAYYQTQLYAIFKIENGIIRLVTEINTTGESKHSRGVLIDGYYYILTSGDVYNFAAVKIEE